MPHMLDTTPTDAAGVAIPMDEAPVAKEILDQIEHWKRERGAIILAHNYQIGPIQDLADFTGDSLGLARQAAATDAETIVFCGVHFMAETAAILSPNKTVLIPDLEAGCSLASSIDIEDLRAWKSAHPGAVVVSYVNTTADIKAESDYCVTSGNALAIVRSIPDDQEILFLPDMYLGNYVKRMTGRAMEIWAGECHVHGAMRASEVEERRAAHPGAEFLIHPECGCVTSTMNGLAHGTIDPVGTHILSTEGMMGRARDSSADQFIVATEIGVLHRLRKENPQKSFIPLSERMLCRYMKMITVPKLLTSLQENRFQVTVPEETAQRARGAIERMLAQV